MRKNRLLSVIALRETTQHAVAGNIGMKTTTFCSKVNGKAPFYPEEIWKVCEALEITDPTEIVDIFIKPCPPEVII